MNPEDAAEHDSYIKAYLRSGGKLNPMPLFSLDSPQQIYLCLRRCTSHWCRTRCHRSEEGWYNLCCASEVKGLLFCVCVPCWKWLLLYSVSENKGENHHTFCATLQEVQQLKAHASSSTTGAGESVYALMVCSLSFDVLHRSLLFWYFSQRMVFWM